jgi:hypothetical protein
VNSVLGLSRILKTLKLRSPHEWYVFCTMQTDTPPEQTLFRLSFEHFSVR